MVKDPMDTLYGDRLKLINLLLLSYRRFRVDLVLALRILNDDLCVNMFCLFLPSRADYLRGHFKKIHYQDRIVHFWSFVSYIEN